MPSLSAVKRDAALLLVRSCAMSLRRVRTGGEARELATRIAALLDEAQGNDDDRPHLMKTLCQVAHLFRAHGWVGLAIEILESATVRGPVDAYVLSELTECHLLRKEAEQAERMLERARRAGLPTEAIYTSLVSAYGRAGQWREAERLYGLALQEGVRSEFIFTAMIATYGRCAQPDRAREAFDAARASGALTAACYAAQVDAYGRAGLLESARLLFEEARRSVTPDARTFTALIRAYAANGQVGRARLLLQEAHHLGFDDERMYASFVTGCVHHGRLGAAYQALRLARSTNRLSRRSRAALLVRIRQASHSGHAGGNVNPAPPRAMA